MKKWQIWTVAVIGLVMVAAASGGLYWWLTKDDYVEVEPVTIERSEEQMELDEVKTELDEIENIDTAGIEEAVKEIEAVDLSGV
jgi:uncharacterized protein YpmB